MKKKKVVKINIVGEICTNTLTERDPEGLTLVDKIRAADSANHVLEIYLCSPGGDIDAGMAIYEMLLCSQAEVQIIGYGIVASIAVLIFMAGDIRLLSPGTRMFVHPGSVMSEIPESILTLKAKSAELMGLHTWYCEVIFKRAHATGGKIDIAKIYELCDKDSFFGAESAVSWGLATGVYYYEK